MTTYMYVADKSVIESMKEHSFVHGGDVKITMETESLMKNWRERKLNKLLNKADKGDVIVVLDAISLARSHTEVLGFLEAALEKGVQVQFIKYELVFKAELACNFTDILNLTRKIEGDFVSQRNRALFTRRKELGILLGRPKGHRNASLKLDKYKKDIDMYLKLAVSKVSIAKLVGCHPQTLYNWLELHEEMPKAKTKRPKAKKLASV